MLQRKYTSNPVLLSIAFLGCSICNASGLIEDKSSISLEVANNTTNSITISQHGQTPLVIDPDQSAQFNSYQPAPINVMSRDGLAQLVVTSDSENCNKSLCLVFASTIASPSVVNNGKKAILVADQKEVDPRKSVDKETDSPDVKKGELVRIDSSNIVVTVQPKDPGDRFRYVTITGRQGACQAETCVFVQ